MNEPNAIGPLRIREILKRHTATVVVPISALDGDGESFFRAGTPRLKDNSFPDAGVVLSGGDSGVARILGDAVVHHGTDGEREPSGLYRIALPGDVLPWIADPVLLWRLLALVSGPDRVEVSTAGSEELARFLLSPAEAVWHCRLGEAGWIVVENSSGEAEKNLSRGLQAMRDLVRGAGLVPGDAALESSPPSAIREGTRMVRLAAGRWTAWWPVPTLNRFLRRLVFPAGETVEIDPVALQRAAAVRISDHILRTGGLAELVSMEPRTMEERRARYAVRAITTLVHTGGVAPRVLAESAYRSGNHYRALTGVIRGLSRSDREVIRQALRRRRWEQLLDHSMQGIPPVAPWVDFSRSCEFLVRDLSDRCRRTGESVPPAVCELLRRTYSGPRDTRLREAWRQQIEKGALARNLAEARLSILRPLLRRLPWGTLVRAGCGDTREVRMGLSAAFSRRGRRMYMEDAAALDARIERGDYPEWDELLAARMVVLAAVKRAIPGAARRGGVARRGRHKGGGGAPTGVDAR